MITVKLRIGTTKIIEGSLYHQLPSLEVNQVQVDWQLQVTNSQRNNHVSPKELQDEQFMPHISLAKKMPCNEF